MRLTTLQLHFQDERGKNPLMMIEVEPGQLFNTAGWRQPAYTVVTWGRDEEQSFSAKSISPYVGFIFRARSSEKSLSHSQFPPSLLLSLSSLTLALLNSLPLSLSLSLSVLSLPLSLSLPLPHPQE